MKRLLAIMLLCSMAIAGLSGCTASPANASADLSAGSEETTTAAEETTTTAEETTAAEETTTKAATTAKPETTKNETTAATTAAKTTAASTAAATTAAAAQGNTYKPAPASLTGTISFSGSTSVYPVAAALTEAFKKQYPKVKVQITNVTGSGAGLADAKAGTVSFGMRSSAWKTSDGDNINNYQIAMDGVGIIVHPTNGLTNVKFADIKSAYEGTLTGVTAPISREAGSGTRTCFEDILKGNGGIPKYAANTQYLASTEAVATAVAGNPNSIGYMSLGAIGTNVKKLSVDGIEATEENVLNGTYKFSRPFLLLRRNDRPLNAVEKEFLKFTLSKEGQKIIKDSNYIALSDAQIDTETAKIK